MLNYDVIRASTDAQIQDIIDGEVVNAAKIAEVVITVTNFKDVMTERLKGKNRGVGFRMEMPVPHNRVRIVPPKEKATDVDGLHVKLGGATIRFVIVDSANNHEVYHALGIAFVLLGEDHCCLTGDTRIGELNFDQKDIRPVGNSIYITDKFKDVSTDLDYEFSIIIQDKNSGAVGIIDPPIIHELR